MMMRADQLLLTLAIGLLCVLPACIGVVTKHYIILIDGGSTGSRCHVHSYTLPSSSALPIVSPSDNMKIKPGLSSFAVDLDNMTALIQHVSSLVNFAKSIVPPTMIPTTPIHLQATAGLRSVPVPAAKLILSVVRQQLALSGFQFKRKFAAVIRGEDEGINGWIATNYLLGTFGAVGDVDEDKARALTAGTELSAVVKDPVKSVEAHGVVEMGGSSMQITFAPVTTFDENDRAYLHTIRIDGETYNVYTHSFLQYGLQAAQRLYQRALIDTIEEKGNPCYPSGYRHSSVGNFNDCYAAMQKIVDKSAKSCHFSSCSFNGVYQPPFKDEPFLAIENFFYTAKFFGDESESVGQTPAAAALGADKIVGGVAAGNQLISALKKKGADFCDDQWTEIKNAHKDTDEDTLAYFCFAAAYEAAVLEQGLGFNDRSRLRPAQKINTKSIDWELGAVIQKIIEKHSGDHVVIPALKRFVADDPATDVIYGDPDDEDGVAAADVCSSMTCRISVFAAIAVAALCVWSALSGASRQRSKGYDLVYGNGSNNRLFSGV